MAKNSEEFVRRRPRNIDGVVRPRRIKPGMVRDTGKPVNTSLTIAEIAYPEDNIDDQEIEDLINDVASEEYVSDYEEPEEPEMELEVGDAVVQENRALNSIKRADKQEAEASKKGSTKAKPYRVISRILAILTTGILCTFLTYCALSNAIPLKYIAILGGVILFFVMLYLFKAFRNRTHVVSLTIFNILGIALAGASVFGFLKFNQLLSYLDNNLGGPEVEYSIYNVIVSKSSEYNSLDDVRGNDFHSISDFIDTEKLEVAVKEQVGGTVNYTKDITSMLQQSVDDPHYISLLNSGTWDATIETEDGKKYNEALKIIGEIKVEVSEKKELVTTSSVTNSGWIMFISGIDTRSGQMVDKSLSDVNIVMTVNPKTHNILLTAIPRDYYVQLHGTTGLPDKLTHAGSLGGLQLSMATVEDLLGIKFNQYLRVNFNAVVDLVDVIGGITVDSDVNYSFKCHTNSNCVINPGPNNLDGTCALAFARERYAYSTGDRHRGENQEQVISKIFEKISSSSTIINKYSDILNALSGSFETSLTTADITSLVNMQLDDMEKWTIESYNLNGTTGGAYTYSYPNQTLSVMFPDQKTIEAARKKIDAILSGQKAGSLVE